MAVLETRVRESLASIESLLDNNRLLEAAVLVERLPDDVSRDPFYAVLSAQYGRRCDGAPQDSLEAGIYRRLHDYYKGKSALIG